MPGEKRHVSKLGCHAVRNLACAYGALLLLCSSSAWAQGFGSIVGTVSDPSGAVIPGASITVTDPATSVTRHETANQQGYFVVSTLRPSTYDITITAPGFVDYKQTGVRLLADQTVTVNATLSIGKAAQTVSVNAEPPQVNTSNPALSEVVEQRRVVDLPLNGRNAASLLLVVGGAIPAPANDVDQGNTKSFPEVVTVSTNGVRQNEVSFRLDGANNNDIYTNANQPFPFPDALQEFSVETSNYGAQYGGNAGGVVNIVTKSGTNELHGDLFEFVRNYVFNARNFFAAHRDLLKRNQYGGTIGGPVFIPKLYNGKDKTFFFFGYQGTKIRNVGNTTSAFVPTAAERNGNFSALLNAADPANPFHKSIQINDRNGHAIPGNILAPSQLDPASVAFLQYLPQVGGNGQIFYTQPISQNFGEYVARGDHAFSENDRLMLRYFYDSFTNQGFLNPANYLSFQNYANIVDQNALIGETHVFGPSAVNDFRASFSRETSNRGPAPGSIGLTDLGVKIWQPPTAKTLEGIQVSGYFNVAETDPAAFIRNQYNLSDDVSLVHAKHTISFGGSVIRAQVLLRNQFRTSGSFSFTPDVTNDALASFMQGYVRSFTQGFGEFKDDLLDTFNLYLEDDYHASRRLTINLGIRYDPLFPWEERRFRTEEFNPADYYAGVHSQVYINAPAGLLFPGDPGVPKWGANGSYNNFAPRVGFAYDLTGDGKTSLRGGAGVFYDALLAGAYNNRFVDVTPFSPQFSVTTPPGTFSNPYVGYSNPFPAPFPPPKNISFQPYPVLAITYDPSNNHKLQTPTIYDWNLTLERQLAPNWLLRVAYAASRSTHLLEAVELNPAVYIPGSSAGTDARRRFQPYGSILQSTQDINANFNSAQVTLEKRFSRGITILANYTWSKALDDTPAGAGIVAAGQGGQSPIPWYLPGRHQNDYGPSDYDHPQRVVVSYVWDLPRLRGSNPLLRYVVGGWQWTGIVSAMSGNPFTVLAGKDQSQTGLGTDRANFTGINPYGGNACGISAPCVNYLNPAAFSLPVVGSFGNVGKGSLRGPNFVDFDTGLFKEIPLAAERARLQFRAEFFNVWNRVNLNNPSNSTTTSFSSGGFGTLTSAQDPRIGQLALKLIF